MLYSLSAVRCSSILALRLLATLVFSLMWHASCHAKTTEQRTEFGLLSLVQETRTPDPGEPPIMHVATEWTKLHLRWTSRAGDMTVDLVDDGSMLQIDVSGHDCSSAAPYQRYRQEIGEPRLLAQMRMNLTELLKVCPRVSRSQAAIYVQEFGGIKNDYVAGVEALKQRARNTFTNTLARCRPRNDGVIPQPFESRCGGTW